MGVNITDEQARLYEEAGFTDQDLQDTVDSYRKQGLDDKAIQTKLDSKANELANPSQESGAYQLSTSAYFNPEEIQSFREAHPIVSKIPATFPTIGAIIGGLAGAPTGGLASAGLAGVGAMGGEELKQIVEGLTGQRKKANWNEVGLQGLFGAGGEGIGQGAGAIFEKTQPALAEILANVPKKDYLRVLKNLKAGNPIFKKGSLDVAKRNLNEVAQEATEKQGIPINELTENINSVLDKFGGVNINPTKRNLEPELNALFGDIEASRMAGGSYSPENAQLLEQLTKDYGANTANEMMVRMGKDVGTQNDLANFYDIHTLKQDIGKKVGDFEKYKGSETQALKGIYGKLKEALKEANYPEYEVANETLKDALAESQFKGILPRYAGMYMGKNLQKANLGMGASLLGLPVSGYAYGATHNPLTVLPELALVSQMSPQMQKNMLKLYGALMKSKTGGGIGTYTESILSPEKIEQSKY